METNVIQIRVRTYPDTVRDGTELGLTELGLAEPGDIVHQRHTLKDVLPRHPMILIKHSQKKNFLIKQIKRGS